MGCGEVRHVSTSTIRPASHNGSTQRIDLTVWDLMLLPHQYMQRGLLFPQPSKEDNETKIITHLKSSLSQALDHFFPFAGRLAITKHDDDDTTSVYINCNSAGIEFVHAIADVTIADILVPSYVPHIVRSFFSLKGVMNYDGQMQPLLSVQVTELIDGIFIGCSINHSVCDGSSFWHFLNSWCEISRGALDYISRPPVHKRWFPKTIDHPIRLPFSIDEHFAERYRYNTPPSFEVRIFHFTPENIARLKAKANSDQNEASQINISSFQALLAHVWVAVTRARCLDPKEETTYHIVVGNRARLNPPLPEGYFGNSFLVGEATAKVGDLLERGLSWGASLLKQAVMSYNDVTIRSYWESWVKEPELMALNGTLSSTSLMTGGSPRFNMYGNDFGWGEPIAVRGGISNKRPGEITAIPGPTPGSVDLEVYLSLEMLKAMEDDAEFMEAVSTIPPFQSH